MSKHLFILGIVLTMILIGIDYSNASNKQLCNVGSDATIKICLENQIKNSAKECDKIFMYVYELQSSSKKQKLLKEHQEDWERYVNSGIDYVISTTSNSDASTIKIKNYNRFLKYKLNMIENRIKELKELNTGPITGDE